MAQVKAHITGTVWKIEVKVGDAVAEGQTVVVLESMKMEMPVESPPPARCPPCWSRKATPSKRARRWSS